MSWIEFEIRDIECPHCGCEHTLSAEFNTLEGDEGGIDSHPYEQECDNCWEKFWFVGELRFEIDHRAYKKEPKKLEVEGGSAND